MKCDEKFGFDLVEETPDYDKTVEENIEIYKERHKKVYGQYPSFLKKDKN